MRLFRRSAPRPDPLERLSPSPVRGAAGIPVESDAITSNSVPTLEPPIDALTVRRRFAAHLSGHGVEMGAGHAPFPVPLGVQVRYVDRWDPAENSQLFPELADTPDFPKPDIVADLDVDRLSALDDKSQDFVIASHVIEHLANPLKMLEDIYRVLRPGGLLVLLVPDRHLTFDCLREPTPLTHLVEEYHSDIRVVDDTHVVDFIIGLLRSNGDQRELDELLAERTPDELDHHRRRSVHAHVWNREEFEEMLTFAGDKLDVRFEVVDSMESGETGTHGNEFGWLFMRPALTSLAN
jgi:SAM-dependent methyltransferase